MGNKRKNAEKVKQLSTKEAIKFLLKDSQNSIRTADKNLNDEIIHKNKTK